MALEMRAECERCRQSLGQEDVAFVCSFECTYCPDCAEVLGGVCETCTGELVRRPRRRAARGLPAADVVPADMHVDAAVPLGAPVLPGTQTPLADR